MEPDLTLLCGSPRIVIFRHRKRRENCILSGCSLHTHQLWVYLSKHNHSASDILHVRQPDGNLKLQASRMHLEDCSAQMARQRKHDFRSSLQNCADCFLQALSVLVPDYLVLSFAPGPQDKCTDTRLVRVRLKVTVLYSSEVCL